MTIFFDDFESYLIGAFPSEKWEMYLGSGATIQETEGSKGLNVSSQGTDTVIHALIPVLRLFRFSVRGKDVLNRHFWIGARINGTNNAYGAYIYPTYIQPYYRAGSSYSAVGARVNRTLNITIYNNYVLIFNGTSYSLYENDILIATRDCPNWTSGYAEVGAYRSGENAYFDDADIIELIPSTINGITRDSVGAILGGCIVWLFRTSDKSFIGEAISDPVTGIYSFDVDDDITEYFIRTHKDGSSNVFGTSERNLKGSQ